MMRKYQSIRQESCILTKSIVESAKELLVLLMHLMCQQCQLSKLVTTLWVSDFYKYPNHCNRSVCEIDTKTHYIVIMTKFSLGINSHLLYQDLSFTTAAIVHLHHLLSNQRQLAALTKSRFTLLFSLYPRIHTGLNITIFQYPPANILMNSPLINITCICIYMIQYLFVFGSHN